MESVKNGVTNGVKSDVKKAVVKHDGVETLTPCAT
jgi:hypothetical protein